MENNVIKFPSDESKSDMQETLKALEACYHKLWDYRDIPEVARALIQIKLSIEDIMFRVE